MAMRIVTCGCRFQVVLLWCTWYRNRLTCGVVMYGHMYAHSHLVAQKLWI